MFGVKGAIMKRNVFQIVISLFIVVRAISNITLGWHVTYAWITLAVLAVTLVIRIKFPQFRIVFFAILLIVGGIYVVKEGNRVYKTNGHEVSESIEE